MTAQELDNGLLKDLNNDELTFGEIIENNRQRVEAYHKAKVEAISDEDIKELISSIRTAPSRKDADAYTNYWFKNKLLNNNGDNLN